MNRNWIAIVNPSAGGGRCGKRATRALEELRARGFEFEIMTTHAPGDATRFAREKSLAGKSQFLAVGGDGTSFEVLNGLLPRSETQEPPMLAMLPLGTGNSFLRDFGITNARAAMEAFIRGRSQPCDALRVVHERGVFHSINIVGVGFSADAGALTNAKYKHLGVPGYIVAVLRTAARLDAPRFPLRLDRGPLDDRPAIFVSFCNSRYTGGAMKMAPHADIADGALDVIRVGPRSRTSFLRSFPAIFTGRHIAQEGVEETRATRVDFELDREVFTILDGEVMKLSLSSIEVMNNAIRVMS